MLTKSHPGSCIQILCLAILLVMSGCYSSEKRLLVAYESHVRAISTTDFPLLTFQSNEDLIKNPIARQHFFTHPDLLYFPVTLWQIYGIKGTSKWRKCAEDYSSLFQPEVSSSLIYSGEMLLNAFLIPCQLGENKDCFASLAPSLHKYMSDFEETVEMNSRSVISETCEIERLLDNSFLFIASRETGDPIYGKFALELSDEIFNVYFQNNQSNDFFHGLLNSEFNVTNAPHLLHLSAGDYTDLAIALYGYTLLYEETGSAKYEQLARNIASVFIELLQETENTESNVSKKGLVNEVDLFSQSLVILALMDLGDTSETHFKETSLILYNNVLTTLENAYEKKHAVSVADLEALGSFRLYYYLFEYEKKKQNYEKGIL